MADKVLMKGNEALAEAAMRAGCRHFFGYPITPQTEISAYLSKHMPKRGGTFLQAESEVAAINMVLGAAAAGVRVMTSSSSPGISLKSEGISYIAGCDLPAVIVNVQRGGPGLGGIQPSQADYFQATRGLGHGDFHLIVLAPSTVQEVIDLTFEAFDMADIYRMPVIMLSDGILGQMMEPASFPEGTGRELPAKDWAVTGTQGKRKKNIVNSLYLQPEELEAKVMERYERYAEIQKNEQKCELFMMDDAEYVVVAYGASARVAKNAIVAARAEGIKVGMIRPITLWPFPVDAIRAATPNTKAFLTVELSMGQMIEDVRLACECKKPVHLCNRTGGMIVKPQEVLAKIQEISGGAK
ncbi:MAG: 3-methyl-2-oxobutanoate dehydrogenase subunit VorB [Ruminococcaceae bacterium]|nr:3-methyl-2-oxobutanoate dehydrogenase subunit VorB [Oscillospiraceae bacterium]